MLEITQKNVGCRQRLPSYWGDNPDVRQFIQRRQSRSALQAWLTAAAYKLKHLGKKFNLAYATRSELDIIGAISSDYLSTNLAMELAQLCHGTIIKITAKYKGPNQRRQLSVAFSRDGAGFDPRIAFPRSSLHDEIIFQRRKTNGQSAAFAIGPQPHVNAKHKTMFVVLGQQRDHALAEQYEKFVIAYLAWPRCFALFWINKNQIDIG